MKSAIITDRVTHPLLGKTSLALAIMGAVLAVPYASRELRTFRVVDAPWDHTDAAAAAGAAENRAPAAAPTVGETTLSASSNEGTVTNALPQDGKKEELDPAVLAKTVGSLAVEDPTGHALDVFYAHLAKTLKKEPGAITRVLHYGDSLITSDFISGTMRRKMQARFGDAGHGFILIANGWEWYFHNDVLHSASDGWIANRITGPLVGDGIYGLGGVSFKAGAGSSATFATKDPAKSEFGTKVSRFDIYYLEHPAGGDVALYVRGKPPEKLSTRGPKKISRVQSVEVPDGAGELTIRAAGDARLFGVALERDVPGVVYDALGANGARVRLLEYINADHWAEQMALRKPALIILQYGTNETAWGFDDSYEQTLSSVVEKVKAAAPEASILIASPLDRAERGKGGALETMPVIQKLVETQRKVASDQKVAFWNTFQAMGGKGSMGRWVKANPQLAGWDLMHPTPAGAEVIGDMLYKALTTGYQAYASTHPDAPKLE